jgi:hypothetical protein
VIDRLEVSTLYCFFFCLFLVGHRCNFIEWRDKKIVYKRYASLFFVACVDKDDNELVTLEMIHLFVEVGFHGSFLFVWFGIPQLFIVTNLLSC